MANTVDALSYLSNPAKHPAAAVCVVFGEEAFLKRLAIAEIRRSVLGEDEGEFSLTRFDGVTTHWRDVSSELSTIGLFGGRNRLVIVENADTLSWRSDQADADEEPPADADATGKAAAKESFVSVYRSKLEVYIGRRTHTGVLLLDVRTWPKTTRLYKAVDASGLQIDCKTPDVRTLTKWLVSWAKSQHRTKLEPAAAETLLEIVGPELGLLDQELAKLAVSTEAGGAISVESVQELVGGWRAKTAWDMIDAVLAGDAKGALAQLDRLLLAGEHPIAVLAQISSTLRRFAAATRLVEQAEAAKRRITLRQALEEAGVKPFVLGKAETQLKQLGRQRAGRLYRWLLDADLDLKGQSAMPPRLVLERLIVRLAAPMKAPSRA